MTQVSPKGEMLRAIRDIVITELHQLGFKGSFPHFRRATATRVELITFQLHPSGGSFVVELASCPLDGFTHHWGKHVPADKVTVHDIGERHRLGSDDHGDHWFVFGLPSYEPEAGQVAPPQHYDAIARSVLAHFREEAKAYWQT